MGSNFSSVAATLRGANSWSGSFTVKFGVLLLSDEFGDFPFLLLYNPLVNLNETHGISIA